MTPRFRADHVGSLLRPARLRESFRRHRDGAMDDAGLERERDDAVRAAVVMQEGVGLHSVTDEFRRASYWAHFVDTVDGLDVAPALFEFTDASGERMAFTAPHVVGAVRRERPICAAEFRFLRSLTRKTPKITMPSPSTMHFWRGPCGCGRIHTRALGGFTGSPVIVRGCTVDSTEVLVVGLACGLGLQEVSVHRQRLGAHERQTPLVRQRVPLLRASALGGSGRCGGGFDGG